MAVASTGVRTVRVGLHDILHLRECHGYFHRVPAVYTLSKVVYAVCIYSNWSWARCASSPRQFNAVKSSDVIMASKANNAYVERGPRLAKCSYACKLFCVSVCLPQRRS
eukprot:4241793-Pleurochrysis_carterae.AAC.2